MTQPELFRETVAHQPHGRFLFYADFTPDLGRRIRQRHGLGPDASLRDFFGMFSPCVISPHCPARRPEEFERYFATEPRREGSFINGIGVLEIPAGLYHLTGYVSPLRNVSSLSEIENFPFPHLPDSEEGMARKAEEAKATGRVVAGMVGHIYENAWQIRGLEQFLEDLLERPAWAECVAERIALRAEMLASAAARAGADYLITGDDIASQHGMIFSPSVWRRFLKPRWKRVYDAARKENPDIAIWYHSDGDISAVIPDLIEIGVTILNPLQPECMDVVALKKEYGRFLVFDGTVGTQSTMPFGTPEEVRSVVRQRMSTLGGDGALILSPTHVLEPEVPVENVEAFCAACRDS